MKTVTGPRLGYLICDYVAANIGWLLFTVVRYYTLPYNWSEGGLSYFLSRADILYGQAVVPVCMVFLYAISGAYNKSKEMWRSRMDETLNSAIVSLVAMLGIYFTALIDDDIPERLTSYELMLVLFGCMFIPDFLFRMAILGRMARRLRSGEGWIPTVVLGVSGSTAGRVERFLADRRLSGLDTVACVSAPGAVCDKTACPLPVGGSDEMADTLRRCGAKAVIILYYKGNLGVTPAQLDMLYSLDIPIYVAPDTYSVSAIRPQVSSVVNEPLVDITRANISAASANLKRLSDIFVSSFALVVLLPLFALLAIAVKLDSSGPVFYRQERVGYRKKPFMIVKYRTMVVDAEENGPALSSAGDKRVTRLGRFMRRYRLDELPQFWNVLKGDMSLVGPRPERAIYVERILEKLPAYGLLHQVRPGVTSWGMVKYGYASTVDQMVDRAAYDLLYINNVSLGVDLKILFHTVSTVLTGKGV